ncbi:MAG TPA: amidohydrolase family protein, partial [Pseudoxanthomonas sp.]|nr:amidohydrolase family protein [Pseudoxanthomonas sp.]
MRLKALFLIALASQAAVAAESPAPEPATAANPVQALHCERLFDARMGKMLGEHTIVVRDGRIDSVLPGRAKLAAGTESIVLAGRTCMPGWTDLHVHLSSQSSPQSYSEGFRLDP